MVPATGAEPYVFLSYASADRERALPVADTLVQAGVRIWVDRRSIVGGTSWDSEIVAGITGCAALLLLGSPAAFTSPNVQQEIRLAWEERRPVVPLLLEPAELPAAVRYVLAGRQRIELLDRPEAAWLPEVLAALAEVGIVPDPVTEHGAVPSMPSTETPASVQLPTPLSRFVGREREVAAIGSLLGEHRLVTLLGPGGTGKTRLAIEAARAVAPAFPDGVVFVPLAPISDPALVLPTLARLLGVVEVPGRPLAETLAAFLRDRAVLLIVDNLEQVIEAALDLARLLEACPHLRLLVTSRIALHVAGEHALAIAPLPLPDDTRHRSRDAIAASPAVQLFVQRAREARATFGLTEENAPVVAAICRRLDGLPLAIVLAAARVKVLAPAALLARLDAPLALLTSGDRDLPERQQTLRRTIQWSYDLLIPAEQALLRRLAVLVGGWTLEAAEAVCGTALADVRQEDTPPLAVLDGLASLVDKSLVRQEDGSDGEPRFTMLQTIREFAREQLDAAGEAAAAHRHLVTFTLDRLEAAQPLFFSAQMLRLVDQFEAERENLRAAFAWAVTQGEVETALALVGGLTLWFWHRGGAEGLRWADQALALPGAERPTVARAKALLCAGWLGWAVTADVGAMRTRLEEAAGLWRAAGERWWLAHTLAWLVQARAWTEAPADGPESADGAAEEAVAIFRELGDRWGLGWGLQRHSFMLASRGAVAAARPLAAEGVAIAREQGDRSQLGVRLNNLGFIAYRLRDLAAARACYDEGEPLLREAGDVFNLSATLLRRATLAFDEGDPDRAAACLRELLPLERDRGREGMIGSALVGFAYLRALAGEGEDAAWLLGGGIARRERVPVSAAISPVPLEDTLVCLRAVLDPPTLEALIAQGRAAPTASLIDRALAPSATGDA